MRMFTLFLSLFVIWVVIQSSFFFFFLKKSINELILSLISSHMYPHELWLFSLMFHDVDCCNIAVLLECEDLKIGSNPWVEEVTFCFLLKWVKFVFLRWKVFSELNLRPGWKLENKLWSGDKERRSGLRVEVQEWSYKWSVNWRAR